MLVEDASKKTTINSKDKKYVVPNIFQNLRTSSISSMCFTLRELLYFLPFLSQLCNLVDNNSRPLGQQNSKFLTQSISVDMIQYLLLALELILKGLNEKDPEHFIPVSIWEQGPESSVERLKTLLKRTHINTNLKLMEEQYHNRRI